MHGDGTGVWVATYRDDTARAFVGAAGNPKTYGEAYNLSADEWMTHNHIWRTIARVMEAPPPVFVYIPTTLLGQIAPEKAEWCVENFRYNNIFDNSKAKRDLGYRYTVNQDVPQFSTASTGNTKTISFGAMDRYIIRDVMSMDLIRLNERYAEQGSVGFLMFKRSDGDLINRNAVKHFITATSS